MKVKVTVRIDGREVVMQQANCCDVKPNLCAGLTTIVASLMNAVARGR